MIAITLTYEMEAGKRFDLERYTVAHASLVIDKLQPRGMREFTVDVPSGEEGSFLARARLTFDTVAAFEAAMAEVGEELTADAGNCSDIQPSFEISEVVSNWRP